MDFRTIALSLKQFVPELSLPVIRLRINQRYQQIMRFRDWEYLNASITTGTSTIVSTSTSCKVGYGATLVVQRDQSGTSFRANHASWWIRFGTEAQPYEVTSVTDTSRLVLSAPYSGTTTGLSAGTSFTLFKPDYVSGVSMSRINSIVYKSRMKETSLGNLNKIDPEMTSTGEPTHWAVVSQSRNRGRIRFRLWPTASDTPYGIKIYYQKKVDDLSADTDIPLCSPELLEAWALYDCYKMGITKNPLYAKLLGEQKAETREILHDEVQADLNIATLPHKVRDATTGTYINDDFAYDHDVEEW